MSDVVMPMSRSLFVCDSYTGYPGGRIDLVGVLSVIRPGTYPHTRRRFVVFVQLSGDQGEAPFFFEIRRESDDELIRTTAVRSLHFADRVTPVNLAMTVEHVPFTQPGVYAVSLFCHNKWVCDTAVMLS